MPRKIKSKIGWKSTPSPRPSGERVGVRGFEFETIGLLTPALSSFWGGEGEDLLPCLNLCPSVFIYPWFN